MLIEIKCSGCGKFNWDSETGPYNEHHPSIQNFQVLVPCDVKGAVYLDGYRLEENKLVTITDQASRYYLHGGIIKSIDREHGRVSILFHGEHEPIEFLLSAISTQIHTLVDCGDPSCPTSDSYDPNAD